MNKNEIDYSLYVVTDRELMSCDSIEKCVEEAILGGAKVIQLREKNLTSRQFFETAKEIKKICEKLGAILIINDRADIALAVGADGIHVGQKDIPVEVLRKFVGDDMLIGVSAATVDEALEAEKNGADYLGVGAMFTTSTKKDTRSVTPERLKEICSSVNIPVVAIGGINKERVGILKGTGVSGAAVVSAVVSKADIRLAAQEMKAEILKAINS